MGITPHHRRRGFHIGGPDARPMAEMLCYMAAYIASQGSPEFAAWLEQLHPHGVWCDRCREIHETAGSRELAAYAADIVRILKDAGL